MTASPQRRRPSYPVASVDNALRLIMMLRDLGVVRGREAADELGISPSSVHRLMSMLVFRGFAVQGESREYLPGPAIGASPAAIPGIRWLSDLVRPSLIALSGRVGESAYFQVLTGADVRFVGSAESGVPLHAEDRHGFILPAHASAAGRAILANMADEVVDDLIAEFQPLDAAGRDKLHHELHRVRTRGYALSIEEVEVGIVSIAVPIRVRHFDPPSAISMAGPSHRLASIASPESIAQLLATRDALERDITRRRHPADSA